MSTNFFHSAVLRLVAVFALLVLYAIPGFSQANFMTIFGDAGCHKTNRLPCKVPPSYSALTSLTDPNYAYSTSSNSGYMDNFKTSAYNKGGQLLFATNGDGIYAPNGELVFAFAREADLTTPRVFSYVTSPGCSGGSTYYNIGVGAALSEIVIFPVPGQCHTYYVMFWSRTDLYYGSGGTSSPTAVLRAIKVTIDPLAFGTGAPVANWYSFTDNIMNTPDCDGSHVYPMALNSSVGAFEIVADALNPDNTRDIYTLNIEVDASYNKFSTLQKWTIPANGSLAGTIDHGTKISTDNTMPVAGITKAKIFTVGGHKLFTYAGISGSNPNKLVTFDITAPGHTICTYLAPVASGSPAPYIYQTILGFEYLSSYDIFCLSYFDGVTSTGGLAYANVISSGTTSAIDAPVSSYNFGFGDLELTANGDMLMIYDDLAYHANLAYLTASELTSSFTSTVPHILQGTCSGTPNVAVTITNIMDKVTNLHSYWYLGSQIRGENYDSWSGSDLVNYIVHTGTNETWKPTDNPVYNASASSTPVTTITVDGIYIEHGASLTINGMTLKNAFGSHIDVSEGPNSSSPGGKLIVTNGSVLTNNPGNPCVPATSILWGGIRVFGSASYSQSSPSASQGVVNILNSTVSYAENGVAAGKQPLLYMLPQTKPGGVVFASNSKFLNNSTGIYYAKYRNFDPGDPTVELGNISRILRCSFATNDVNSVTGTLLYGIYGYGVNGVNILGCQFTNSLALNTTTSAGTVINTYGIYGVNMGFNVNDFTGSILGIPFNYHSSFANYYSGIYHTQINSSYTPDIRNATFTNNMYGINLFGSLAPLMTGNRFNIPDLSVHVGGILHVIGIRSIGILLNTADQYIVANNAFVAMTAMPPDDNWTVGVDAVNTGGDDNLINANSFDGLGAANLAHFKNVGVRYVVVDGIGSVFNYGLNYMCNVNNNNRFDISAVGNDVSFHGIRLFQGYPPGSDYAGYHDGLPAGNTFTHSTLSNVLNLQYQDCALFQYYYAAPSFGDIMEHPGIPSTSMALQSPLIITQPLDRTAYCPSFSKKAPHVIAISQGMGAVEIDRARVNNINFYAKDTAGIPHRDSLYYWVGYKRTPYTDLLAANMLIADSLVDSANAVYDNILACYDLDEMEENEFAQGRNLMNIIISNRVNQGGDIFMIDSNQVDSLRDIAANSKMWPHVRAVAWLAAIGDTVIVDTLSFPSTPDPVEPGPNGVLAVTEISNGPSGTCEYAEMIVANCGENADATVNISGWIIDDNAGIFNKNGRGITNISTGTGHYRFAQSVLWQNVPVGSVIVVYNKDANCYNIPGDGIKVDTTVTGLVYWVPIGGSLLAPYGHSHMERHLTLPNVFRSDYCGDKDLKYQPASGWSTVMGLDNAGDGFQVRCPGCSKEHSEDPAFYHGIGYGPSVGPIRYRSVAAGPWDLGAPVKSGFGAASKFIFTGSTKADLGHADAWTKYTADAAGSVPSTLGNVNTTFMSTVMSHTLGLPCCNSSSSYSELPAADNSNAMNDADNILDISVYPTPANETIYFQFPLAAKTTVRLFDVSGRLMTEQVVTDNTATSINVKDYAPGLYLFQVITDSRTESGKIVIEK